MENKNKYKVQDVEKWTGINRKQIYDYDLLGIIKPIEVDNNGYKYYDEDGLRKFGLISLLVELGETPKSIQKIFNNPDFDTVSELRKISNTVDTQIIRLHNVKESAEQLIDANTIKKEIEDKKNVLVNTDKIVSTVAALGVPGLILMISVSATGLAGAAALTTALAALGPFGMAGGIATLGVAGIISQSITKYGFEAIFKSVLSELYKKGESKETIIQKINNYPISKELKLSLVEKINEIKEGN